MANDFELNARGMKKLQKDMEQKLTKALNDSLRSSRSSSETAAASKLRRDMAKVGVEYSQKDALGLVRQSRGEK